MKKEYRQLCAELINELFNCGMVETAKHFDERFEELKKTDID
jgi:hypothetical protein